MMHRNTFNGLMNGERSIIGSSNKHSVCAFIRSSIDYSGRFDPN